LAKQQPVGPEWLHEVKLDGFRGQRWHGPAKKDGPILDVDVYAFLTTAPNDLTKSINHERMPVLLSGEDQYETWLSGPSDEAFALARSIDPALMWIVQSGKMKEDRLSA
jgi:putative SOS response-associated peptidase YedK